MSRYIGNYLRVPSSEPQQASAPGVWSLSDQLAYQRANLWPPARDPYYNQTVLHLSGDVAGTRETNPVTQPRTFLSDASTNNFLLTPNGDVSARPFSPYGGNNYSVYFPGGTARVQFPSGNIIPASGTYTIECWIYPTSLNATYGGVIASQGTTPSGDNGRTGLTITAAGILNFGIGESFPSFNSGSNVIKLNQWTHVAITRNNTVFTMYINGNRINQVTSSKTTDSGFLRLGTLWDGDGNGLVPYVGYISNFRIVYSVLTDFTNRTDSLTAISNTALLTCQSNRFIDNSSNNYLATIVGSPQVSDNSPFVSYDTTSGSGYFNGSTGYLTWPGSAIGTSPFCFECWFYPTSIGAVQTLFGNNSTSSGSISVRLITSTRIDIDRYNVASSQFTVPTMAANQWYHLVACRDASNNTTIFLNGFRSSTGTISDSYNYGNVASVGYLNSAFPQMFGGNIAAARLVVGSTPYDPTQTTITIPTTPLTAITNTQLLTLQTRAPANNHGILDTSPNSFVVTRTGNVAQGSFSPFSAGGWSVYINNGTSSQIRISDNAALRIGTSAFNIEAWVYPTSFSEPFYILRKRVYDNVGVGTWSFTVTTNGSVTFEQIQGPATIAQTSAGLVPLNTWTHVAVSRDSSNNVKIFINGTIQATATSSYNFNDASNPVSLLCDYDSRNASSIGYASNLRFVIGSAVYTANFTPATSNLTSSSQGTVAADVKILTFQYNRFRDASTNNFSITTSGSPSVQPFSPFAPTQAYVASQLGGSAYFDGTSDYLSFAVNQAPLALGNSDFTVEAWVYRLNTNTAVVLAGQSDLATGAGSAYVFYVSSSSTSDLYSASGYSVTSPNPGINQWAHVAWARTGGTYSSYLNGVRVGNRTDLSTATVNTGSTTYAPSVGGFTNSTSILTGYISGLRLIKGSGGYNANDTNIVIPTAPPTPTPNTSLLLNFTGAGIVDSTGKNVVETVGNAHLTTSGTVPVNGTTGILVFDGTGDFLKMPYSEIFNIGSGDYTVEAWIYPTQHGEIIGAFNLTGPNYAGWLLSTNFGPGGVGKLSTFFANTSASQSNIYSTTSVSLNTWSHVVFTKQSTTIRLFINGNLDTTGTLTLVPSGSNQQIHIGADSNSLTSPTRNFGGYIDDLRITKGYARYAAGTGNTMIFTGTTIPALPTKPFSIG